MLSQMFRDRRLVLSLHVEITGAQTGCECLTARRQLMATRSGLVVLFGWGVAAGGWLVVVTAEQRQRGDSALVCETSLPSLYAQASKTRVCRSLPGERKKRHASGDQQAGSRALTQSVGTTVPLHERLMFYAKESHEWEFESDSHMSTQWSGRYRIYLGVEKGKTVWIGAWELGCCCFGVDSLSLKWLKLELCFIRSVSKVLLSMLLTVLQTIALAFPAVHMCCISLLKQQVSTWWLLCSWSSPCWMEPFRGSQLDITQSGVKLSDGLWALGAISANLTCLCRGQDPTR